jgi:hypothetical protein
MDTVSRLPVINTRRAGNCLWATPTVFLSAPFWFDAEARPWTCLRDTDPRALSTTDRCAACPRWEREGCHLQ